MTTAVRVPPLNPSAVTSPSIRKLQGDKAAHVRAMRALTDKATAENRDLSPEESAQFNALKDKVAAVNVNISREADLLAEEAGLLPPAAEPRVALPGRRGYSSVSVDENIDVDGTRGFREFGEFLKAVVGASTRGGAIDERLMIGAAAPSTFGNEAVGPDGGFAIPPQFAEDIWMHTFNEQALLPMTDLTTISANSMVFPKDETTPWGTDGLRAYWQQEATLGTQVKPKLSTTILRLYKLMALVPVSDELIADTSALNSYIPKKVGQSILWKINEAILWGNGAGQPQGAFQGNSVITVAKESGQATLTLQALNLAKMIARLPDSAFGRALWILNNDVLPALFTLTLGNYPIYLPPTANGVGGLQVNPYGYLLGRPIMVSQHAKSFTNQGDVLLLDPTYIRAIQSAAGMQTATSMHIYFDADVTAFRTIFRMDSQPKIVNPIAPFNGSNNLSPFVQLGAR